MPCTVPRLSLPVCLKGALASVTLRPASKVFRVAIWVTNILLKGLLCQAAPLGPYTTARAVGTTKAYGVLVPVYDLYDLSPADLGSQQVGMSRRSS